MLGEQAEHVYEFPEENSCLSFGMHQNRQHHDVTALTRFRISFLNFLLMNLGFGG